MYYYIYADKDATIYSDTYKDSYLKNTGLDEIIELQKTVPPAYDSIENSRILLKFDVTEVSKSMATNMIDSGSKFNLKLYTARPTELPLSYTIEAYPISGSWSMGMGKKYYSPQFKDGVSWRYKTSETVSDGWITASFGNAYSTGSVGSMYEGGGNWYTDTFGTYYLKGAVLEKESPNTTAQNNTPEDIYFKPDGTKFYIIGTQGTKTGVFRYSMLSPWDVGGATYDTDASHSLENTTHEGWRALDMKSDGTTMWTVTDDGNRVFEYNLSTPWDLTTATKTDDLNISSVDTKMKGIYVRPDGKHMYTTGREHHKVYMWELGTDYDISTATLVNSYEHSESILLGEEKGLGGIRFRPDGYFMYTSGQDLDKVYEHRLTTAWDITTAMYHSSIGVNGVENNINGLHWGGTVGGSKLYIIGHGNDKVHQYDIPEAGNGASVSYKTSQDFEYQSADINMSVDTIVRGWISGSISNDGIIIKRTDTDEQSAANFGNLNFFSRDTHTIYPPRIEIKWDDSKWNPTHSMSEFDLSVKQPVVYMKDRGRVFKEKSKTKFRVYTRDQYKTQDATIGKYEMFKHYYLPTSSYYSIKDTVTEETIIPFSDESKLSADSTSNYFNMWMNGLQPERYYRVIIKAVTGSGTQDEIVQYYDDNFTFKVVR